jgi:uridine kinase
VPDLHSWLTRGADPIEWQTPVFAADLAALCRGEPITLPNGGCVQPASYVVVEDPFGRARREMAPSIDLVAFLDVPLDVAMLRKLRRETNGHAANDGPHAGLDRLNRFVADYLEGPLRATYIAANESAKTSCDLILDGMRPVVDLARELTERIRALSVSP